MSPTNPVYQRFYKTAGPTLVRWAGLQQRLLGAEGAPVPDGLGAETPEPAGFATQTSAPTRTWDAPVPRSAQRRPAPQPTAVAPPMPALPPYGETSGSSPQAHPAPGAPRLDLSPAAGIGWLSAGPSTSGSRLASAAGTRWQDRTDDPQAGPTGGAQPIGAVPQPPASIPSMTAPTQGAFPLTPAAAASPALGALLEAATRRSRRQELLLALATAHAPTAHIPTPTHQPTQSQAPGPQAAAPDEAPAIRFTAPTAPAPSRPDSAPPPAGEDDFLYEERLRATLEKILRTDALRHGLQLGER